MTPFLKQVASIYATHESSRLKDYCFVFPNKRSAAFFNEFLTSMLADSDIMPDIKNISDFISDFSPLVEADRYDQLFTLFKSYIAITGNEIEFDRFLFWADMIISDFNDVDRYLVDPEQLFVNLSRLREISSNYLTDEQLSIIRRYWGEEHPAAHSERFWNHIAGKDDASSPTRRKFIRLWEILLPLYRHFTESLANNGLATPGRLYRIAAETVADASVSQLNASRFIFVGFNMLSTSELTIFSRLQKRGMADFYWDCNPGVFNGPTARAATFVNRYNKEFPSRYPLPEQPITSLPRINIIGVPSNTAQAKIAGKQIESWIKNKTIGNTDNAIDTAIVLPNEQLFIPTLHSMPETIADINVTMGFPMRLTPMAALMRSVISMQLRVRHRNSAEAASFFHSDVNNLLSTPLIRTEAPDAADRLQKLAVNNRWFYIAASAINETLPRLAPIFTPIANPDNLDDIRSYILNLCTFLANLLPGTDKIQLRFLESYRKEASALFNAASSAGIPMNASSFFRLLERAINSSSVNFSGHPLKGLQIMGVLETRSLDFKNIIVMSMNERIFPRKHYSRSFIPNSLRRAYGMATLEFQETMFAYYFYRLIGRAENVTLLYDARTVGGVRNNEKSRYLSQLLYLRSDHPESKKITHSLGLFPTLRFEHGSIAIKKTHRIQKLLDRFKSGGSKNLSASAINSYLSCPLSFYLRYVEGYDQPAELVDYMDSSTYGSILHGVLQQFYDSFPPATVITRELIERYLKPGATLIPKLIVKNINLLYNHLSDELAPTTPLVGETYIIGQVLEQTIRNILLHDLSITPFTYRKSEMENRLSIVISPELSVNFRQFVDRVDEVNGILRFIDYKTGIDATDVESLDKLFSINESHEAKVILQLLLYCHIYRLDTGYTGPITPLVYKSANIASEGVPNITIGGNAITDYRTVYDEFVTKFNSLISEIFNPDVPFIAAPESQREHTCRFCPFKAICGVKTDE